MKCSVFFVLFAMVAIVLFGVFFAKSQFTCYSQHFDAPVGVVAVGTSCPNNLIIAPKEYCGPKKQACEASMWSLLPDGTKRIENCTSEKRTEECTINGGYTLDEPATEPVATKSPHFQGGTCPFNTYTKVPCIRVVDA